MGVYFVALLKNKREVLSAVKCMKCATLYLLILSLPLALVAKNKIVYYQAYSGPPLSKDQVATIMSDYEVTIDGRDTQHQWDGGGLREGCKASRDGYRCDKFNLLEISVLPGVHKVGVDLAAGPGLKYRGENCASSKCTFTDNISVKAGKTYGVSLVLGKLVDGHVVPGSLAANTGEQIGAQIMLTDLDTAEGVANYIRARQ